MGNQGMGNRRANGYQMGSAQNLRNTGTHQNMDCHIERTRQHRAEPKLGEGMARL